MAGLRKLLGDIVPANAFYRDKLQDVDLDAALTDLQAFSSKVPFTTKRELVEDQQSHPPYGTVLTYPIDQYTRFSQTSATGSTPMRWLDTPQSWSWMVDNWKEVFGVAGVARGDRCFFAFSFGPFLGFWTSFQAAEALGCLCVPGGGMRSTARLRMILDNAITVLCCTPTYAIYLGKTAVAEAIDLNNASVRTIIVAGEPGGSISSCRTCIEKLWPTATVYDHHGMTEVGPVSFQCRATPGRLHVISAAHFAEVVNLQTGTAVTAGEAGELVLTTLGRAACPLVRYRTGDLIRSGTDAPCECGRSDLALDGGILSRIDDMVTIRGVNVYPAALEEIMRSKPDIEEYRVTVDTTGDMPELRLEIEANCNCRNTDALVDALRTALSDAFNLRIEIQVVDAGILPRFELKARRWVRAQ